MLEHGYRVAIITASDKGARGEREDISGQTIEEIVAAFGYRVVLRCILPDEQELLAQEMLRISEGDLCDLLLTTGGTGFSPRDITPEATLQVIERQAPGIAEAMRMNSLSITKRGMLSRGVAGIRKKTLIINLPGSPKAVRENLEYIIETLEHGIAVLKERDTECARKE